jgi:hypothetical protein
MIYVIKNRTEATLGLTFYGADGWEVEVENAVHFASLDECHEQLSKLDSDHRYDDEPPEAIALCCDGPHSPRTDWSCYGSRVWREGDRHFVAVHCEECLTVGQIEFSVSAVKWAP